MLIKQSPITINQDFFYNHIFSSEMVIYHYPSNPWITIFWTATRPARWLLKKWEPSRCIS